MKMLTLSSARSFLDDYPSARPFYAAMGFAAGLAQQIVDAVAPDDPDLAGLVGRFLGLSLQAEDILATCRTLEALGVVFCGPPERQYRSGWLAHTSRIRPATR
jgi:hypothetical protein